MKKLSVAIVISVMFVLASCYPIKDKPSSDTTAPNNSTSNSKSDLTSVTEPTGEEALLFFKENEALFQKIADSLYNLNIDADFLLFVSGNENLYDISQHTDYYHKFSDKGEVWFDYGDGKQPDASVLKSIDSESIIDYFAVVENAANSVTSLHSPTIRLQSINEGEYKIVEFLFASSDPVYALVGTGVVYTTSKKLEVNKSADESFIGPYGNAQFHKIEDCWYNVIEWYEG